MAPSERLETCCQGISPQINLEGQKFRTENFVQTTWKQTADIIVRGKRAGIVEVCYLEERPASDEGPFLKEERNLLNAITGRLGRIIGHVQAEEALHRAVVDAQQRIGQVALGVGTQQVVENAGALGVAKRTRQLGQQAEFAEEPLVLRNVLEAALGHLIVDGACPLLPICEVAEVGVGALENGGTFIIVNCLSKNWVGHSGSS